MNNIAQKINNFFDTDLEKTVQNVIVLQDEYGNYELFNKYHLKLENNFISVSSKYSYTVKNFSSLPVAVTWCIFDKRNKIVECKRIEYLDNMLIGIESSILLHKNIIRKNSDNKFISLAKLSQDQYKRKALLKEMKKFIKDSKNWQMRQFSQI